MTRVNVDNVPALARPPKVDAALDDVRVLRGRAHQAEQAVAASEQAITDAQRDDVEAAAARLRGGDALGPESRAIDKARSTLALRQRDLAACKLALGQAEDDAGMVIVENVDAWLIELDAEAERAREVGRAAIAALAQACETIGAAASARRWLDQGVNDGRFDRALTPSVIGSYAPTSKALTANAQPLNRAQLLDLAAELIDPPEVAPPQPMVVERLR
jgi:hypothetical protein